MGQVNVEQIRSAIRDIPDFPKPGILFKDITPILGDGKLFHWVIDRLAEEAHKANPSKLVGIDARGFLFGAAVAYKLGVGCVPVRKKGNSLSQRSVPPTNSSTVTPRLKCTPTP